MDQSFLLQRGQYLHHPLLTRLQSLVVTGSNEFDEAFSGLGPVKKMILNQIFGRHKIEPGTPIVIKKQPESFFSNLYAVPQVIEFFSIHGGCSLTEPYQ
jgi:hypothetical protein